MDNLHMSTGLGPRSPDIWLDVITGCVCEACSLRLVAYDLGTEGWGALSHAMESLSRLKDRGRLDGLPDCLSRNTHLLCSDLQAHTGLSTSSNSQAQPP